MARGSDERLQTEVPTFPCVAAPLRQTSAAAGRRTNIRWPCSRWCRGADHHVRDSRDRHRLPGSQTQYRAKAMLRMRSGLPSEHERDLTLIVQALATAQGNATGPNSEDSEPFRAAVHQPAALVTLLYRSAPQANLFIARRCRYSFDLDQGHYRSPDRPIILPQRARIERIVVLGP